MDSRARPDRLRRKWEQLMGRLNHLTGNTSPRAEAYLVEAQRLAQAGSWAWNVATREFVHWSREHYRLHGLDPAKGTPSWEEMKRQVHPEDLSRFLGEIESAVRERSDWILEYRLLLPDGATKIVRSIADPVFDAGGELVEYVGTEIDVTESKRMEEALRESEARFRTFVDHAADAFLIQATDDFGRIRDVNRQACESLGYSREELIGRYPRDFDVGLTLREVIRIGERVAGGETFAFETRHRRKDGTEFPVEIRIRPFQHGGKNLSVAICRDVTELKRLELQLRDAQKMEAMGRLAGGVAHDFNNLLTVITGYGEIAFNMLGPDHPCRGLIAEVRKAGDRAANLTRQLLAFSRKQVLLPRVISLNPLLADIGQMLQRLIGEGVELRQDLDPSLGRVKVDPGQFEQAVMNLAINARDAMRGAGSLSIETRNVRLDDGYSDRHPDVGAGEYAVISVSDTGHGMDEATKARIFEPFFTTKYADKCTGLGLAMVHGFVKQSGGHIEVESEPGRGTTFRLFLPRTEESGPSSPPPQADYRIPEGDETILLVEDEEAVRTLTRMVLQSYGYKVIEARDGMDGLLTMEQYPGTIHLVVTDLVMPRMGGRELADNLMRMRRNLRILFMSGHTEDEALHRGEVEAGEAFVHKPFSPLVLARQVRQLLDAEIPVR